MSSELREDGYTISRLTAGVLIGKLDVTDCNFVNDTTISLHLKDGSVFNVTVAEQPAKATAPADKPNGHLAKTMADLVTPKQLVAICAISNAHGVNAETHCLETRSCKLEELSRRAASGLIDELKSLPVRAVA